MNTLAHFTTGSDTLVYETRGDPSAPPILLAHGWLSYRGVWRQTLPVLQEHFFCVALDLLGFGDSDKPAGGDYSIPAQAQRLLALADHLGLDRFSLAGHSMGGQVCTWLAARLAPQRVENLVSVGGVVSGRLAPRVEWITYPLVSLAVYFPPMRPITLCLADRERFIRFLYRSWFYRMDSIPLESWEIDRRMAVRPEIVHSAYHAGQAIHACDLTADLPQVTARTLGIYGRQDGTVPFSDGELLRRGIPGAQLAAIDACGHFPMYEQTASYLDALAGFLCRPASA